MQEDETRTIVLIAVQEWLIPDLNDGKLSEIPTGSDSQESDNKCKK